MLPTETVHALWQRFEARDWAGARELLHDHAALHWPTSGEHFEDADAAIRVQAVYPEGWHIRVIEVNPLADGRVHSSIEVTHGVHRFFANSFFRFEGERIADITEYWATFELPPAWRNAETLGAYRRDEEGTT
jgi:ketosteroid isomerase-like protein